MSDERDDHRAPEQDRLALEHRRELRERLRTEWIAGAEEKWRRRTGRPTTSAELERLLQQFPGDRIRPKCGSGWKVATKP